MWPFSLFSKKEEKPKALLPDIKRAPVDPEFKLVWEEYDSRRSKEKMALCLEGGGAKGRWQAGVLARFSEIGLLPRLDVISGTSVGGLNALVTARYMNESPGLQDVVDIWRGISKNSDIYLGEMPTTGVWAAVKALTTGKLGAPSLLDVSPLHALVKKHLEGFTGFDIPVHVITTDYVTKKMRVLGPGILATDMALATSAVPGAFPAHQGKFLDGGCSMNNSHSFLVDTCGATKIVVLYVDPDPSTIPPTAPAPTSVTTGEAAIAALFQVQSDMAYTALEAVVETRKLKGLSPLEVMHYYPEKPNGDLLQFGGNLPSLQAGYDTAVKYLTPAKLREFLVA